MPLPLNERRIVPGRMDRPADPAPLSILPKRDPGQREFEFTQNDFERVRKLIYQHAGISLAPVKFDMVYSRLARRLRALNKKSFTVYLDFLEQSRDAEEWERFVNSLTTNLTSFFREPHHFPILADHLRRIGNKRPIRIWCSAASTGEEPYSIAMTVAETFGSTNVPVNIFASDLDTNVLATASRGVYPIERVEKMPPERVKRFFLKGTGVHEGMVCVRPELHKMVQFARVNLLDTNWPVQGPLDVIFCRNVMIYFDKPTQHKILSRFAPLMQPDGLMFAGHSESFLHAADLFKSLGKTVYCLTANKKTGLTPRIT